MRDLFNPRHKLLLAVSGGLDSMLLLHLLHGKYPKMAVAHCNFQLRGAESDGDEALVRARCRELGVQCFVRRFDTREEAEKSGKSIQETARDLRYGWFDSLLGENGFDRIVTAHHAGDQVETFFLNLLRSSGSKGLRGIPERRGAIVRPLLPFSRKELEAFARKEGIEWREDSSNAKRLYRRNALRLEILPLMEAHFPDFAHRVLESMAHLEEEQAFISARIEQLEVEAMEQDEHAKVLNLSAIKRYPQANFILYRILSAFGFNREQSDAIWRAEEREQASGQRFESGSYQAVLDRGKLRIQEKGSKELGVQLWQEGEEAQWNARTFHQEALTSDKIDPSHYHGNRALMNRAKIHWPLTIRSWQERDRIQPLGMKGSKLLSDLFIDAKIPLDQKKEIPIIEDAQGQIIWVVGLRVSEAVRWREGEEGVVLVGLTEDENRRQLT